MALHSGANLIEEFIYYLAIFMRGLLAGRVSGELLYPEASPSQRLYEPAARC